MQKAKAAAAGKTPHHGKGKDDGKHKLAVMADKDGDELKGSMGQPLHILERMVNQNTFDEISEGTFQMFVTKLFGCCAGSLVCFHSNT